MASREDMTPQEESQSDESIGRPAEWREGRYQQADKPLSQGVVSPPGEKGVAPQVESTPVTRKDYENLNPPATPTSSRPPE